MDILKQADLEQLMGTSGEWCVSLYMPTHKLGREQQQDPIRLDNLIKRAQEKLIEFGLRSPEARELLRPAENLLTDQEAFWQHQSEGLAIFLSNSGLFKNLRLPLKFDELVVIANNFHLKPLLPLLSRDGKFYILAVSMDEIRLFLATKDTIEQVDLVGVPTSMQEALWMDDPEKFKGFHTSASSPGRGERQAVFHGHGAKPAEDKTNLLRYFRYVDAGLNDMLEDKDIPMVLAGVDYLLPIYHEASTYNALIEEGLGGNPEELSPSELHLSAWELVKPIFEEAREKDVARFEQFHGQQNELASADLKTVVKAAHFGQVETLFVPVGTQVWGRYDPGQNQVRLDSKNKPENQDLLNYAAMQTIINSGQVYAVQPEKIPGDGELAAILRYAA